MRQIEKPELISTIRDKKKVWLNIRESRLMYMFHRKLISMEEYEAGSRYRLMCELMGGGTGNVTVDGNQNGTANTGGGAGAEGSQATNNAGNGGSGVVILRYPSSATINQIGGLTLTTFTESSDKVTAITAGTGQVYWE